MISVVIPAFNEEKSLALVLASLKGQNYPGKFEVIVVDNDSTDKTAAIAHSFGVTVICETGPGVAAARQRGFEMAKAEIICSTDADCILESDWLCRIATLFRDNPHAIALAGGYDLYDSSYLLTFVMHYFNDGFFRLMRWYSGANMAIKTSAFRSVGGFNTDLPLGEDSDLMRRLRKVGKVIRLSDLRVKTSGRRFNDMGFWAGAWSYLNLHSKLAMRQSPKELSLQPGSELPMLSDGLKLAINSVVLLVTFFGFWSAKPVEAKMVHYSKGFTHHSQAFVQQEIAEYRKPTKRHHYSSKKHHYAPTTYRTHV